MTLVLAFGVQGIADALTFGTSRSGDLATELPAPNDFDIRFSVSLKGNTAIRSGGNLVNDTGARIDSSGYLVAEVNGREYRTIPANPSGTLVIDPRPRLSDDGTAGTPSGTQYVDSSRNVVDSTGAAVYVQTGDGTAGSPWRYTRAKADPNDKVPDANRYHYNQEQVTITVTGASITHIGRYDIPDATSHILMETGEDGSKLTSSITVTLSAASAATVAITITDTTPDTDRPTGIAVAPPISFTVYVVPDTSTEALTLTGAGTDGVATGNDLVPTQIDGLFTVADNVPLTYEVTGSGRVFVQASEERTTRETNKLETSSSAPVYLKMNRSSNKVTVWVRGTDAKRASQSVTFINQYPDPQITGGNNQRGATEGRLPDPLEVTVKDANNRVIPGGVVVGFALGTGATGGMFIPVVGTTVYTSATDTLVTTAPATPDALTTTATSTVPGPAEAIYVKTDSRGVAQTYFQLGTNQGSQRVTITVNGQTYADTFFRATATDVDSTDAATITIIDGDNQRADADDPLDDPLIVLVRDSGGRIVANAPVTFTTNSGELSAPEPGDPGTELNDTPTDVPDHTPFFIVVNTDDTGRASVRYNVGDLPGAKQVFARISVSNGRTRTKTFNVNGRATSTRDDPVDDDDDDDTPTVTVRVPTSVSGTAGGTETLTVTAPADSTVTVSELGTFPSANASSFTRSGTTFTSTLTLPNQAADYSLIIFVGNTRHVVTVEVAEAPSQTGTLSVRVEPFSGAPGSTATVTVTATDSDGDPANITVTLSATGGTLSTSSVTTGSDGTDNTVRLVRGSTPGNENYVTASATDTDYDTVRTRFLISGTAPPLDQDQRESPAADEAAGDAMYLDLYSGDAQSGSLNTRLSEPFVVEVLDANEDPVEDVRVRFRVTVGSGTLRPRTPRTDEDGFAEVYFTPTSSGRLVVAASVTGIDEPVAFTVTAGESPETLVKVSGDAQNGTPGRALANPFVVEARDEAGDPVEGVRVTFRVTAGGGSLSETSDLTNRDGRAETTLTLGRGRGVNSVQASVSGVDPVTFSSSLEPDILVAAANRPPMLWVDDGAIYALVGEEVERFASGVEGAMHLTLGGGKVYWTEKTGESAGTINAANLDGSGATELTAIKAVPRGIAVDTTNRLLYWTNSRGRIQSANLDGSGIQNVMENIRNPNDLALAGGNVYWTESNHGSVRFVNLKGQKQVGLISTGDDPAGSLVIAGGKVYWTEQTGDSGGTINAANLNGSDATELASILAAPMGIAVDTARNKLFWTNARGRIQCAALDGTSIRNVVSNLRSPGDMVLSNSIKAPAATPPTKPPTTAANYDVDGSNSVDNADVFLVALAVGTSNAKYDVNGDGTVDDKDIALVRDNRDDGAAAAPMIVGMKLSADQIGRLQDQIDLLIATGDRSPAAMKTLIYLQQLLAMARPEKTQLLANYPNPFNPETWMPYELATDTNVKITIYNTHGVVIRTLALGHQSAGYYTGRERAAYWDGRNAFGEQVASGIYFYQLETDDMSSLRKMVILK